jgi:hypothetical protein
MRRREPTFSAAPRPRGRSRPAGSTRASSPPSGSVAAEFVRLAEALGLDGPPQLIARADQVIA